MYELYFESNENESFDTNSFILNSPMPIIDFFKYNPNPNEENSEFKDMLSEHYNNNKNFSNLNKDKINYENQTPPDIGNNRDSRISNNSTASKKETSPNKNENIQSFETNEDKYNLLINLNNNNNFLQDTKDNSLLGKKKNRGRKKNSIKINKNRSHNKYSKDNIKRKIQVHYLKFLRNLLNQIINQILKNNCNIKFYPLNHHFTQKIDKDSFKSIKNKSLGNIFKDNVSQKYKEYESLNIDVYNKVTSESTIIKNILDKPYLEFIRVYYFNNVKINLSKYGLNKNIILSKDTQFFEDLIKIKESQEDINYNNKIHKVFKESFYGAPIFVCNS